MKASSILLAFAATVSGHAIFQKISIDGADQGQLKGVRAPSSNYPIQNVNDPELACNKNIQYKDNNIHSVNPGARIGAWWGHVIGGPQGSNDPDNPIASSHKGPISYYLAKVSNAASASASGLTWFKVAEDGLTGSQWAVDRMISGNGWHYFTLPTCVAPGDYLLRVELIALHSASIRGEAQFYVGCAQIRVGGSGTNTGSGSTAVFPGAYSATDPGILVSIYDNSGNPSGGGRGYTIPGPRPITCSGSPPSSPPTSPPSTPPSTPPNTPPSTPPTTPPPSGSGAALYGQCGGSGWTGPTTCASGKCTASNQWYSQCLP